MADAARLSPSNEEIARAISGHRFELAYPHLDDGVSWTLVGAERLEGREAFIAVCESTAAQLKDVTTEFSRFRVLSGDDWVVIDSVAAYASADGSTTNVASCDLYQFRDGRLIEATSYNIELGEEIEEERA